MQQTLESKTSVHLEQLRAEIKAEVAREFETKRIKD
jgi:hypothetical protein